MSKKKNGLKQVKDIPNRFKDIIGEEDLYLLKSKLPNPPDMPGYKLFGIDAAGYYYIKIN